MFSHIGSFVMKLVSGVKSISLFTNIKFGILSGLILVISLFSLLQLFSIGYLSHILDNTKDNVEKTHHSHQQEVLMDRARMELLIASDKLNRAGIYYMEDKETGSEGSWQSLLSEATKSIQQSQDDFRQLLLVSTHDDRPEFIALKESYLQLFQGLSEISQGLVKNSNIDAFFEVPIQGFQSDFTEKYYRYLQESEENRTVMDSQLLSSLSSAKQAVIIALVILLCLAFSVWLGVTRWVIRPLNYLIAQIHVIAAGDLSHQIEHNAFTSREVRLLAVSIYQMQQGLVVLVSQVRSGVDVILTGVNQIAADSHRISEQTQSQTQSLAATTQNMYQLTERVKQNSKSADQANQLANEAKNIASQGGDMMSGVVNSMADISAGSQEIAEIITLIESVAFQTNILALNAAIEAAHAGQHGRGFSVVAREVGILAHQSGHSALNIKRLIGNSSKSISAGANLVGRSGDNLRAIIGSVIKVTDLMTEISAASQEQSKGIEDITAQVGMINEVTRLNADLVDQSTQASEVLQKQIFQLNQSVARFCLPVTVRPPQHINEEVAVSF
ncbi:TPA: Tar ligand binding domain-containing protein [Yersinia enterocolitica]|nr:putative methyl-accepting chemotaxis protein [Yersinia enterocolitica]HDL6509915.1 Tar ligand binding domain-containing protein [Yersinia enterocolitica]HDL8467745.1 Tar ligand binding domain-containing protein [Yersinia enterocolitica]HDL8471448.1 Tar ligand binding domain-containing protein [Yersinia enterocolitica]HDL8491957.1 Tar ligand binding domain-containing protein [Yersinia enterocolitica]